MRVLEVQDKSSHILLPIEKIDYFIVESTMKNEEEFIFTLWVMSQKKKFWVNLFDKHADLEKFIENI